MVVEDIGNATVIVIFDSGRDTALHNDAIDLQSSPQTDHYGALAMIIEIHMIGPILCIICMVMDNCCQTYIFGDVEYMGGSFSGMDYYHWRVDRDEE